MSTPTTPARPPYDPELGVMLTASPLPETIVLIEGAGPETLGVQCNVFSGEVVADF